MLDTSVRPSLWVYLRQLWVYRELLENLIKRDIKAETKQSLLGYLWIFAPPLFQTGLFSLVFQAILKLRMTETVPYPLYLYCTTLPWQMFAGMVSAGTNSVVGHGGLIKQVYFPKEVVALSGMTAVAFRTLIATLPLSLLMFFYGVGIGLNALWVPLLVAIQALLALGIALPLATLNAVARDVSRAVGMALSLWMYLTPVVYPLEKVPAAYRDLYMLNPMAVIIHAYRQAVLENAPPAAPALGAVALLATVVFLTGYAFFKRTEGSLADVI